MIDWSYNLLSEAERRLLRYLSVFAGGWTLEAIENVVENSEKVLDLLGQLADKSLILAFPVRKGEMRYHMLETVRQYAHARLVESGEIELGCALHLDYYLRLAERLEPRLRSRDQISTLDELERELDNLRLALGWALQADIEAKLRLASALQWFWLIRNHGEEGTAWLEQGLMAEAFNREGLPPEGRRALVRAKALTAFGLHVLARDGQGSAKPNFEEALNLYQTNGPEHYRGSAWALMRLGSCNMMEGHPAQGQVLVEEALSLFRKTGDSHGMTECLYVLGDWETDTARQKKSF